jgi:hypothetical protein
VVFAVTACKAVRALHGCRDGEREEESEDEDALADYMQNVAACDSDEGDAAVWQ